MHEIIEVKIIESLCQQRAQLISAYRAQIEAVRLCHQITTSIDHTIPAHKDALYDYMSIVFMQFKDVLKESRRNSPQDCNLINANVDKLMVQFTKLVDSNLWAMLFNRLNIYSLMSANAKSEFKQQLKDEHREFNQEAVEVTLNSLLCRREEMLYNSLFDCLSENSQAFASNSKKSFQRRTVFEGATFLQNNVYYALSSNTKFTDALNFLSRTVFAKENRANVSGGVIHDSDLAKQVKDLFTENGRLEKLSGETIEFTGGSIVFFNNFRAHLHLEPEVVSYLNNKISGFNYLPDSVV
mgnify:CR=1 FL=1|tara:strand:- start:12755 stop:13645 length:891 start_codon:yes stop_codon:yes gene_type:complete